MAKRIDLADTVNSMVESLMPLSPDQAVLAMVPDTLRGRSLLYR